MQPRDVLALILGGGAVVAVVLLAISEALTSGHVSADASTLFSTVLGALIGAVATYLGSTYSRKENTVTTEDPQGPEPEQPDEGELVPAPVEPDTDDDAATPTLEDGEGDDVGPDEP